MTSLITPRVFISYARSDGEEFALKLRERLEKEGIPLWQDRAAMEGGRDWWLQITEAIDQVEFMVLVMSPNAISSKMVRKEWRYARQQGVCVYPVKATSNLDFSLLPRWMSSSHWYDLDHEWIKFVNDLNTRCQQTRIPFMVEELPEDFVPRPVEFDALLSLLLNRKREEPIAITAALKGAGGYGKTTLAKALCHNEDIHNAFDEGILWVTLGEKPGDLIGKLEDLIYLLGKVRPGFKSVEAATTRLSELLADRDILMIIDDVWNAAHLKPFLQGGPRCARLVTTRMVDTLPKSAQRVDVDAMRQVEAVQLLCAGIVTQKSEQTFLEALAKRLGEWPTLLKLVNGALRERVNNQGQSLPEALTYVNKALDRKGLTFFDARNAEDRHQAVAKTIGVSLELLSPEENERFSELAVFPEDIDIPLATLEALWGKTGGLDEFDVEALCEHLFNLSLLLNFNPTNRQIRFHDVIRLYLIEQQKHGIVQLHEILLSLYRPATGWTALSPKEPYLWDHLAYHLSNSENYNELRSLFANDGWLHARIPQSGYIYSGYLADLAVTWEMVNDRLADGETYMADCFHYGLIRTSINSLAGNYVPELVVVAVESGLWSPERALSVAEKMPSIDQVSKLFTLLLGTDILAGAIRTSTVNKALDAALAIRDEGARADALTAVAVHLSGEEKKTALRKALNAALAIGNKKLRAKALTTVATQLHGEEKEKVLRKALEADLTIGNEWSLTEALVAVAVHLSGEEKETELRKALNTAIAIEDEWFRAEALATVTRQLNGQESAQSLRQALDAAIAIGNERLRAKALVAVAGQMSSEEKTPALRKALDAALVIEDEWFRAEALATVAVHLSGKENAPALRKALDASLGIGNKRSRAEALTAVAGQLNGEERETALRMALDDALAIENEWARTSVLAAVAEQLNEPEKATALRKALDAALVIRDEKSRAPALAAVAKQLSGKEMATVLCQAIDTALAIRDQGSRVKALAAMAGQLNGEENAPALRQALEAALDIRDEGSRALAWAAIAGQLSSVGNSPTPRHVREGDSTIGYYGRRRTRALAAVNWQLSGEENAPKLRQVLDSAHSIEDEGWQEHTLASLLPQLDKTTALLHTNNCLHCFENTERQVFLQIGATLFPQLPLQTETFDRIAKSIAEICSTWKWL